jgi:hypothetical protein
MVSSTLCVTCAGILKQSMGARNRVGIELDTKSVEALRSVEPLSNGSPLIFHKKLNLTVQRIEENNAFTCNA